MKRIPALALTVILCFSLLSACGTTDVPSSPTPSDTVTAAPSTAVSATQYRDTVRIVTTAEISDPVCYAADAPLSRSMYRMSHEGLYHFDSSGVLNTQLAKEAIDVNGDGTMWKIILWEGVSFHFRGKYYCELKASDVAWTYEFIKSDGFGVQTGAVTYPSPATEYIKQIEVNGDYELTFHLNSSIFDFPALLIDPILSEKAMDEHGYTEGQDCGSGPYYINRAESFSGQQWVFTRYDDHRNAAEHHPTKNIVFLIKESDSAASEALQADEADLLYYPGSGVTPSYQGDSAFRVTRTNDTNVSFLGFNFHDGIGFFGDEDSSQAIILRQAIRLAIDKDALCAVLFAADPSSGNRVDSCFSSGTPGFIETDQTEYDPEKALEKMKQLGYKTDNRLKLRLAYRADQTLYAQILQDQLRKILIDIELLPVDSSVFSATLRSGQGWDLAIGTFDTYGAAQVHTIDQFLGSSSFLAECFGLNSSKLISTAKKVTSASTKKEQAKEFQTFQQTVNGYIPFLPTHTSVIQCISDSRLEGFVLSPSIEFQNFSTVRISK